MNEQEFKRRTKQIGLRVIRLVGTLPHNRVNDVSARQILRSATSVGANYRAVSRAKSNADMIAKLTIVEEEADETLYWLEILVEAEIVSEKRLEELMKETDEIVAMVVSSIKTLRTNNPKSPIQNPKS